MSERNYWLDLFTTKTWREFLAAGGEVSGFRATQAKAARGMKPGDHLLAYITGASRFVGILEVQSPLFEDSTRIWAEDVFPARVRVKVLAELPLDAGVPMGEILDRFSWAGTLRHPSSWVGHFRSSPRRMTTVDGEMIAAAIREAQLSPVVRPIDPRRLTRRVRAAASVLGPVVIPEPGPGPDESEVEVVETPKEASAHTEIQWLLLKLGSDMGLDVWVARNDRGRDFQRRRFDGLRGFRTELPRQFDPVTSRTVELIDVLWLDKNSIEAAFEIESTTSIYSGLLRLADLIALQPNLKIPLYIVAPDDRRDKVISEINRPVFRRLDPPMSEVCQFLSFSALRDGMSQIAPFARRVDPGIIRDWAETTDLEEA